MLSATGFFETFSGFGIFTALCPFFGVFFGDASFGVAFPPPMLPREGMELNNARQLLRSDSATLFFFQCDIKWNGKHLDVRRALCGRDCDAREYLLVTK